MDTNTKAAAKSKYVAETGINHDGRDYAIGDEIELTEAQAKPLLAGRAIATADMASREAREAPKARQKEADEREAATARAEYDRAKADADDADRVSKEATAKAADAKAKADAAKQRLAKIKAPKGDGPQTWEQDADKLGGGQLSGTGGAVGTPAKAPASGAAMTPSSPTAEALDNQ